MFEKELEPLCLQRGIGVINFYALASGFLTGKYRQQSDISQSVRGDKIVDTYLESTRAVHS